MTTDSIRVGAESPARTAAVAAAVAGQLRAGDVVLLHGELAAGKTTFVAGAAAALGSADQVTSPTFMLAQFYAGGRVPVLHIDTYRLTSVTAKRFKDIYLPLNFPFDEMRVEDDFKMPGCQLVS